MNHSVSDLRVRGVTDSHFTTRLQQLQSLLYVTDNDKRFLVEHRSTRRDVAYSA